MTRSVERSDENKIEMGWDLYFSKYDTGLPLSDVNQIRDIESRFEDLKRGQELKW